MTVSTCPCCRQKVLHADHYQKGKANRDYRAPCDTCKHQETHMDEYPCVFCSSLPNPLKP